MLQAFKITVLRAPISPHPQARPAPLPRVIPRKVTPRRAVLLRVIPRRLHRLPAVRVSRGRPVSSLKQVKVRDKDKVRDKVRDRVRDKVKDKVRDKVKDKVRDRDKDKVKAKVKGKVRGKVKAKVRGKVKVRDRGKVKALRDKAGITVPSMHLRKKEQKAK